MKYYCIDTGMYLKISKPDDYKKRSFAVKNHITRRNIHIDKIFNEKKFEIYHCSFCGYRNNRYFFLTEIKDNTIEIIGIDYTYDNTTTGFYYCWGANKECSGRKLNPNSADFVSKSHNVSLEQALNIIHKRNSTPFYSINHSSLEDYIKFQSRDDEWLEKHNISKEERHKSLSYSHSLECYLKKYGEKGYEIHSNIRKSKAITLESLMHRHGNEKGKEIYDNWKKKTSHTLDNFISRYGFIEGRLKYIFYISKKQKQERCFETIDDLIDYSFVLLQRNSLYKLKDFNVNEYLSGYNSVRIGLETFNISLSKFIEKLKEKYQCINSIHMKQQKRGKYGYVFFTNNGSMLRSKLEYEFYIGLKEAGFDDDDLLIDGIYPNSKLRYDFYIKSLDLYIEIAGLSGIDWYDEKMDYKKNNMKSLIIKYEDFNNTIDKLKDLRWNKN